MSELKELIEDTEEIASHYFGILILPVILGSLAWAYLMETM